MSANTSETKKICRCPACGSTGAVYDGARSTSEGTLMTCPACGHEGLFDRWEVSRDWYVEVELPAGALLPAALPPQTASERAAIEATASWYLMAHNDYAREDRVVGQYATQAEAERAMARARQQPDADSMWVVKASR